MFRQCSEVTIEMILNFGTLEVDNILCKETVESGIDFVYKCGNNFKSHITNW